MLDLVGLVLTLMVVIYAVSRGMLGDLVRPYVVRLFPPREASVMSRGSDEAPVVQPVSSLDGRPAGRTDEAPAYTRDDLIKLYTYLRACGVKREALRPLLRPFGVPLSNDVWAACEPPPPAPPPAVTPIAGRPYDPAAYQDDPDLRYTPLAK